MRQKQAEWAILNDVSTGWHWCSEECEMHINCLDLYASWFFILKVAMCDPHQYAHQVIVRRHYGCRVCTSHIGGTKLASCELTRKVWQWCRDIWISAAHLLGSFNIEADWQSRNMSDDKGWQLEHRVVQIIIVNIEVYDTPCRDLFASRLNKQLDRYVSWHPDPDAKAVDAFSFLGTFV